MTPSAGSHPGDSLPLGLPLVVIAGRPNVGKSTLYNRLVGAREALMHGEPGVTRDVRYGVAHYDGRDFRVVDTGGLDPEAARKERAGLPAAIHRMASRAIDDADLVVLLVDGEAGVTPLDREIARDLRKRGKRIVYAANKVDSARREAWAGELYELGAAEAFGISAVHGRGMAELCDAIVAALPPPGERLPAEREAEAAVEPRPEEEEGEPRAIRLAIVGRPNAGKSSLVNRLLGEERVVVHALPGTTTDAVDTPLRSGGRDFLLIDTAGIRRQRGVTETAERVSVQMALDAIGRSDVVAIAIDAAQGPAEQDARIAGAADEKGRAVLLVLTKWDLVRPRGRARDEEEADPARRLRERLRDELPHVAYAPILLTSSVTGRGVERILEEAKDAYAEYTRRVPTAELNRFFAGVLEHHPPPSTTGRPVKMYYITQVAVRPPTFVVSTSNPESVPYAWRRYLANQLREQLGFRATPLRVVLKRR